MLKLYENIKTYRKAAKLTQEDLAKRTGYTDRSSIARIEKGEIDLPQSKIKQFAEALGTTPGQLLGWDAEPEDLGGLAAEVLMDPDLLKLVQNYLSMGETDRYVMRLTGESLAAKTKKD
jgi:transcriptional regulator with XRE-family HTH domain